MTRSPQQIAETAFAEAIDQRHAYPTLYDAIEAFGDNAADTADELGVDVLATCAAFQRLVDDMDAPTA
jgi:hypothetical protein